MENQKKQRPWGGVSWVGIGVACSLVGCSWLGGSKSQNEQSLHAETASGASATQEGNAEEIIFAGLSGNPPRFIDSGPLRGMGWQEEETREIRKGLRDAGFKLKMEYMTPARIEHEFQSHHPICTYPVEWKDPEKTFSQAPDRIYSIALDLGGETTRSIIINKADASKFSRHRKSNGNIDIDSLLADSSLKTLMIRDKDYGRLSRKVLVVNQLGEQGVRPEFQRNVNLLVIRDNRQIIEMLNANRFDYYFSEGIEDLDFTASGLDRSKFQNISYDTGAVRNIQDPALVRVSIACAIHPLTIRAMPHFNQWIQLQRGQDWVDRKGRYRKKFDEHFARVGPPSSSTTISRFTDELISGGEEKWYLKQQKHFGALSLFPKVVLPRVASPHDSVPHKTKRPLRWTQIPLSPERTVLLSEADSQWLRGIAGAGDFFTGTASSLLRLGVLSDDLRRAIEKPDLFENGVGRAELRSLIFPANTRDLTVFAAGLGPGDLDTLLAQLATLPLSQFTLLDAGFDTSKALIDLLPDSISHLRFFRSSLIESGLAEKVLKMPLKELSLDGSQLGEDQTRLLFKNLPTSLESIAYSHGSLYSLSSPGQTPGPLELWAQRSFPRLRTVDLTDMNLGDEHAPLLAQILSQVASPRSPKGIEVLRLGKNHLSPKGVHQLLSVPLKELSELDLSGNQLISSKFPQLKIPESVERLSLQLTGLDARRIRSLSLPSRLSRAEFRGNPIGDAGFEAVLARLVPRVERLDFSGTGITGKSLSLLSKVPNLNEVSELLLASNQLNDAALESLQRAKFSVKRLDLSSNLVSNQSLQFLSPLLRPGLEVLNLSENLLNEEGTRILASKLPSTLQGMILDSVYGLDIQALSKALPPGLGMLSLAQNQISDSDLEILAPRLSSHLYSLDIQNSSVTDAGMTTLVKALPKVSVFRISGIITSRGLDSIGLELSPSLKELMIKSKPLVMFGHDLNAQFPALTLLVWKANIDTQSIKRLVANLPNSLQAFTFEGAEWGASDFGVLVGNSPRNLRYVGVYGSRKEDSALFHFEKLPKTVSDLRMIFSGTIRSADWVALGKRRLDQLQSFQFLGQNCFWPKEAMSAMEASTRQLRMLYATNCRFEDGSLDLLGQNVLRSLSVYLQIQNAGLTVRQIEGILPRLRSDIDKISFKSNALTDADLPWLIKNLPRNLGTLVLSGNPYGEKGREFLRAYKAKRDKEGEAPFVLVE